MSSLKAFLVGGLALLFSPCGCDRGAHDASADTDTYPEAEDPQIEWVEIPAGSFTFGSPIGTPCRGKYTEKEVPVTLTRPFLMSKYETTQKQWKALGFEVPHNAPLCEECPVTFADQFEAMLWCNALSHLEGLEACYDLASCAGTISSGCPDDDFYIGGCMGVQESEQDADGIPDDNYRCDPPVRKHASMYDCAGYRLPTGAEWEYAAKAGTTTNTYNGDLPYTGSGGCVDEPVLNDIAWYCANSGDGYSEWSVELLDCLREVGLKQPNPFGLYDMLGNASEWVDYVFTGFSIDANEDKWDQALVDPMGTTEVDDNRRDIRGGGFHRAGCYARPADQFEADGWFRRADATFRPVRTLANGSNDSGVK